MFRFTFILNTANLALPNGQFDPFTVVWADGVSLVKAVDALSVLYGRTPHILLKRHCDHFGVSTPRHLGVLAQEKLAEIAAKKEKEGITANQYRMYQVNEARLQNYLDHCTELARMAHRYTITMETGPLDEAPTQTVFYSGDVSHETMLEAVHCLANKKPYKILSGFVDIDVPKHTGPTYRGPLAVSLKDHIEKLMAQLEGVDGTSVAMMKLKIALQEYLSEYTLNKKGFTIPAEI